MNRKEGSLVTIVILSTFIAGVFASTSASQVLNVFVTNFPKTHVGQDPASLVTLRCGRLLTIGLDLFCTRSHSDGTLPENFTVPVGTVLVVTDVDWSATFSGGANSTVSFVMRLRQYLHNHTSWVYFSYAVADANGFAFKDEHLTTGFVVSPGATLQAIAPDSLIVMLYGYLVNTG